MAPMPGNLRLLLAPLTPMSLVVSMRWPPAKWSPVSWCSERTIENLSVTLACLREQLGDVEAGHVRADRLPDAAILGRGVRLHVVQVHVAGPAVEPDQDDGGVLGAADCAADVSGAQELRQAEGGQAGDAELQEAAAADAVAVMRGASEVDAEHGVGPPGRKVEGDRGGAGCCSAANGDRTPRGGESQPGDLGKRPA